DATDCKICPKNWRFYKDNCYWISEEEKNWSQSLVACRAKNSTLLAIQDEKEREFIKNIIAGKHLWLGVIAKHSGKWRWETVDESPIENSELLSISGPAKENKCGRMGLDIVFSESCDKISQWICKKVAFST
ncbi:hypothetical protein lerEdw1_010530, partial [Lerista edwardsae]